MSVHTFCCSSIRLTDSQDQCRAKFNAQHRLDTETKQVRGEAFFSCIVAAKVHMSTPAIIGGPSWLFAHELYEPPLTGDASLFLFFAGLFLFPYKAQTSRKMLNKTNIMNKTKTRLRVDRGPGNKFTRLRVYHPKPSWISKAPEYRDGVLQPP